MFRRLGRLESTLERLVKTLESESRIPDTPSSWHTAKRPCDISGSEQEAQSRSSTEPHLAPMFLIRDAAIESNPAVSPSQSGTPLSCTRGDVISAGLITAEFASSLIELYVLF